MTEARTGRMTVVKQDMLLEAYSRHKDELSNALVATSSPVWAILAKELNFRYSAKYLYTMLKMNRYSLMDKLGLSTEQNEPSSNESDQGSEKSVNLDGLKFVITLSNEEWESISPSDVLYKCQDPSNPNRVSRMYPVLKSGYQSILSSHFWDHTKLPCCLAFSNVKVCRSGTTFLKIQAHCSQCNSKLSLEMEKAPNDDSRALFQCTYTGAYMACKSSKKRKLLPTDQDKYTDQLLILKESASSIRRKKANELMELGDKEPAILPTSNALRVVKCRRKKERYPCDDVVESLHLLKYSEPLSAVIKLLCLDPFIVHYWTPSQVSVYNNYAHREKIPTVCIDATGGIVKKIRRPYNNISSEIFLYSIVVPDERHSFNVCNMISERHNTTTILHMLNSFFRTKDPVRVEIPKQAVSDHSLALQSAIVQCFTEFSSVEKYIEHCARLLLHGENLAAPECFIRCDIAHTVKIIASWSIFRLVTRRIKQFYVRSICCIVLSQQIGDIERLLFSILLVAISEDSGFNEDGNRLRSDIERDRLKERIASGGLFVIERALEEDEVNPDDPAEINSDEEVSENTAVFNTTTQNKPFLAWAQEINTRALAHLENSRDNEMNALHLPLIAKKLVAFITTLPLWSAVMVPVFQYGNITAPK